MRRYSFNGVAILTNPYNPPYHSGEDYALPHRTAMFSQADGVVCEVKSGETRSWVANTPSDPYKRTILGKIISRKLTTDDYGNYVKIFHGLDSKGRRMETLHAHFDEVVVFEGQPVKEGELIGFSDSKGNSTGHHDHAELRANGVCINPNTFDYSFKGTMGPDLKVVNFKGSVEVEVVVSEGLNIRSTFSKQGKIIKLLKKGSKFEAIGYCEGESISGNNLWWRTKDNVFIWSGGTNLNPSEIVKGGQIMTVSEFEAKKAEFEARKVELEERERDLEEDKKLYREDYEAFISEPVEEEKPVEVVEETAVEEVKEEVAFEVPQEEKKLGFELKEDMPSDVKDAVRLINNLVAKYADYLK